MTTSGATIAEAALGADLDRIAILEREIRAAQAEQLRLIDRAHGWAHSAADVHDGSPQVEREFATRSFIAELATLLHIPEATASGLIADGGIARRHPDTIAALGSGAISLAHVRSLFDAVVGLPAEDAARLEAAALERAPHETASAFRRRIRRLRDRLHSEPLTARHDRARDRRRVCLEPAEDGMAWLSLYLEAERGVAIMARLDALADAQSAESSATRAHSKLDAAADLLLGRPLDADAAAHASPLGVVSPRVYVTVPVLTLLGHTDEPAELDGHGPIDAETARRLAAHAPSFRRILTHPHSGASLSYDRTVYRVPADLAGYLRVRDGTCRFPGCSRRAVGCDIDHTRDWATGGDTRHDNLAHLCRKHHRLKHNTRWRMSQMPSGDVRWTSPAGHEHLTSPEQPFTRLPQEPPWATAGSTERLESDAPTSDAA
ncbi:HNH endonuclease signature motif containing protein [Agromyces mariniharenae]|uniref:DUF222 domain-containing protein n=1 Tax=Agromyces mariniharenae TaxID=2604423 RepID=A0A5S4VB87_9MICO|nr:HNH endonuclease signature motif containing protein [Agromyces mariniharenae]TYL53900.1 DUF222 domain-containing protein [Agromyces mariniharenae]